MHLESLAASQATARHETCCRARPPQQVAAEALCGFAATGSLDKAQAAFSRGIQGDGGAAADAVAALIYAYRNLSCLADAAVADIYLPPRSGAHTTMGMCHVAGCEGGAAGTCGPQG